MKRLRELMGSDVFDNPKDEDVLAKLIEAVTSGQDMILDFFGGSCSTAHSVMNLNRQGGGSRRFIMVQLPEPTPDGSEAKKRKYLTISEIGKERIRRVIKKWRTEVKTQPSLFSKRDTPQDLGFRVFKLAESHYRPWRGVEDKDGEKYADEMALFTDPLLPGWKPVDVIHEVALKEGFCLTCRIEQLPGIKTNAVYRVTDDEKGQEFRICLDDKLEPLTAKALELKKEDTFVCRDTALTDDLAANLALQCRLKTI
jgi:adenine-specific DNA-methyltransferase